VIPDFIVDVSTTMSRKRDMLAAHASQRNWLRRHHDVDDYIEQMETWTRARGRLAKLDYGEGFRIYPAHPYPQTRLLEELLGAHARPVSSSG
jgi:hypothetical protein